MRMIRKITKEHPLKILGFTDTHLDDYQGCLEMTMKLIQETIRTEQPDLVIFVGDNVTGGENRERARRFQEMMTSLQVPWAPILGNHEGDNPSSMTRREMIAEFCKSPYCLVPKEKAVLSDGTEVVGETDYVIVLENDEGTVVHKLIFLDSGNDVEQDESQMAWYLEQVEQDSCPSTVFVHSPLPEFAEGYEKGTLLFGDKHEGVSYAPYNSRLFDAALQKGTTTAFVAGHDHVNDFRVLYKGIYLIYNRMSGMSSYNMISKSLSDRLLQGCTVYEIDADGVMTVGDIYYEDRYPQYRDDIYRVIRMPGKSSE